MHAFRRVVELRSFSAAGRDLQITGSAVSKLVAQLESDLGARLLDRTTRNVAVNADGAAYYDSAVRVLDAVDEASDALRRDAAAPAGRLRASVPTSFGLTVLAPLLPGFMASHPRIQLDLSLNDRYVDLVEEGFDCAVRIAHSLPDSSMVARPLGPVDRLVAAPSYLDTAPPLRHPGDLEAHACLVYSQAGGPAEWAFRSGAPLQVDGIVRVNNSVMLRELLLSGLGVTLTPAFVVADLLARGKLVEVLPSFRPPALTVFGIVPQQRFVPQKVRAFLDFLQARIGPDAVKPSAA